MWWIAACLGALLWLLAVRIKLKEKERQARRDEHLEKDAAEVRRSFIRDGFTPVAASYLEQDPDAAAVVLLLAHFGWDDKPSEVHMEVLPVRVREGEWPALATACPWVKSVHDKPVFEPPQVHWERLTGLELWLDKLSSFADVLPVVPAQEASLEHYRLYAWALRDGEGVQVRVVGEPVVSNATRLQKQSNVI